MSNGDLFDSLPEEHPGTETGAKIPAAAAESVPAPVKEEPEPPVRRTAERFAGERSVNSARVAERPHTPPPVLKGESAALGGTLAELRRQRGLDIRQVAESTRINPNYIEALEEGNYNDLPQMIYVLAYAKRLCELYGVESGIADELVSGLREHLAYEIPEDIDKSVVCREADEDNRRKIRNITTIFFVSAALLLVLLIGGGAALVIRAKSRSSEPTVIPAVNEQRTLSLWDKPELRVDKISASPVRR